MKSCLWKLQQGFWSYGLIRLLSRSGTNAVSRPQTPRSNFFRDFMILLDSSHDSWENEVLFVKIAARVLDVWLDTFSGPKWPKCSFWVLKPQGQEFFWDFMILLDSSHDSWENDGLFVKIAAMALDIWLDTSFGPKWPKCSFWVPDPKVKKFFEISWFYWIHLMILEKMR